ncbi:MAG: regulatory protein RecX [Betaproteobacteria bacterium]|nr:regulatory protein RecX [Betaproteobacteria bacterium]
MRDPAPDGLLIRQGSGPSMAVEEVPQPAAPAQPPRPEDRALVSRAIAILARRDMSRAALIAKLLKDGYDRQACETVARWCESQGFLNEHRHAEAMARRLGARYGAWRVALGMRQKGVDEEAMETALDTLRASEADRAGALVQRKFGDADRTPETLAQQQRFLRQRGFSGEVIRKALAKA